MMNFRSVSISGAFHYGRARAIWSAGLLRVFGVDGIVLEVVSETPIKRPGFLRSWDANTASGTITIKGKCMTCGGRKWWRILYMPTDELWSMEW